MSAVPTTTVKLNDSNYHVWSYSMTLLLRSTGTWKAIEKPDEAKEASEISDKAMTIIILSLEESQLPRVIDCKRAHEMWNVLKDYHQRSGAEGVLYLQKKFRSLRYSGSMKAHLEEL